MEIQDASQDALASFKSMVRAQQIHWEQAELIPFYEDNVILPLMAHEFRLGILEAKTACTQSRCCESVASLLPQANNVTEDILSSACHQVGVALDRLMNVCIPRWIEECIHSEMLSISADTAGGGSELQRLIAEVVAEHGSH